MTTLKDVPSFGAQYRYGSHRGPTPPKHCMTCGRPMRVTERPSRFGFDTNTGERPMERRADCTAPWLLRISHWHAYQDEHGDWPWSLA